jgi:hypothetical protein
MFSARLGAVALALVCGVSAVHAAPFGLFDPRSMAMGGTGVSSGTSANASHFNPALLSAARPKDRFSFEMMAAGRVADPDKLADDVDRMDKSGQSLTDKLNQFNQATTLPQLQTAAGSLATALGSFRSTLATVNNKALEGNGTASLLVGVPGKDLGWAIHAGARADFGAKLTFASSDDALLTSYQKAAQDFSDGTDFATLLTFGSGGKLSDPNYQSRLDIRGAVIEEFGVSLAREFQTPWDNIAVGITPKSVKVATFDYSVDPQHAEITKDKGRLDYSGGNFDIGVAKDFGSGIRGGLVGKNMLARDYTTALGNTIQVKPQLRAGLSYQTTWSTVAFDLDLTENKPVSFDKPTRYAALGAEIDVWSFLQLRVGYRSDLAGNYGSVPSVGLGISIFGLHVDAAASGRSKDEASVALQLGFRF